MDKNDGWPPRSGVLLEIFLLRFAMFTYVSVNTLLFKAELYDLIEV